MACFFLKISPYGYQNQSGHRHGTVSGIDPALPHPQEREYFRNNANDHDVWIAVMQRIGEKYPEG